MYINPTSHCFQIWLTLTGGTSKFLRVSFSLRDDVCGNIALEQNRHIHMYIIYIQYTQNRHLYMYTHTYTYSSTTILTMW